MSNATATLWLSGDQSNASVDEIEIYQCCGYAPYLSVFPVSTHSQYSCRSEIPITACVSVINNTVDSLEVGKAVMEAVHQCSAQGLQFTPEEHSPECQECC